MLCATLKVSNSEKMLEHHADAQASGLCRVAHDLRLTLPDNGAGVRLRHTVNDLHQRAFARAVLAQQRVDFSGLDGQVDSVVCQTAGVLFGDMA